MKILRFVSFFLFSTWKRELPAYVTCADSPHQFRRLESAVASAEISKMEYCGFSSTIS